TAVGCGDNIDVQPGQHDPGGTNTGGDLNPLPRTYPEVCGVAQWTTVIARNPALDLSVVRRPYRATPLAVPRKGGTMTGFAVDDRMNVMTDPNGTKVEINDAFTEVGASIVDNRLVATAVDLDSVRVNLLDDNLGNPQEIAKLPGTMIAK